MSDPALAVCREGERGGVALAPPLRTQMEKDIVKSYGGWTGFCHSYGYKPFNPEENEEAAQLLRQLALEETQSKQQNGR